MFTKPLARQTVSSMDLSGDLKVVRRLLTAAAISPRFCSALLDNPDVAVRTGFGGEKFYLSDMMMNLIASIRVSNLPEFIQQLDKSLSNRLLTSEYIEAP